MVPRLWDSILLLSENSKNAKLTGALRSQDDIEENKFSLNFFRSFRSLVLKDPHAAGNGGGSKTTSKNGIMKNEKIGICTKWSRDHNASVSFAFSRFKRCEVSKNIPPQALLRETTTKHKEGHCSGSYVYLHCANPDR